MTLTKEQLDALDRKEIQALAKKHGLKANLASEKLKEQILAIERENFLGSADTSIKRKPSEALVDDSPCKYTKRPRQEMKFEQAIQGIQPDCKVFSDRDIIEVHVDGLWVKATIVRINKKSVRVRIHDSKTESNVQQASIRVQTEELHVEQFKMCTDIDSEQVSFPLESKIEKITSEETLTSQSSCEKSGPFSVETLPELSSEPFVHEITDDWAMSMEKCLQEMSAIKKKSLSSSKIARSSVNAGKAGQTSRLSNCRFSLSTSRQSSSKTPQKLLRKSISKDVQNPLTESNQVPQSSSKGIENKTLSSEIRVTSNLITTKSGCSKVPRLTSKSSFHARPAPDFSKQHKDIFNSSKSITAVAKRSDSIEAHLDSVVYQAQDRVVQVSSSQPCTSFLSSSSSNSMTAVQNSLTTPAQDGAAFTSARLKVSSSLRVSSQPNSIDLLSIKAVKDPMSTSFSTISKNSGFKAKPMPNFSNLHAKLQLSSTKSTPTFLSAAATCAIDVAQQHMHSDKENNQYSNKTNEVNMDIKNCTSSTKSALSKVSVASKVQTGRPQKTNREDTSSGAARTKIARITTIATKSGATFTPARATSKSSAAAVPRLKPRTSFTAAHSERDTNTSFEIAEGGGALEFENPFADVISREVVVMSAAPPSMVGYDD